MNKSEKLNLIKHLRKLGNYEIDPHSLQDGLCSELCNHDPGFGLYKHQASELVESIAVNWMNYSGQFYYPLRGGKAAYWDYDVKWSKYSKYGRDRRAFCLFMVDELEKEL